MTTFELPPLPYPYDALEPWCPSETLELHHDKHHATYVKAANDAVAALCGLEPEDAERRAALTRALTFNVAGHVLHSLLWENLAPEQTQPSGGFVSAVKASFGSVDRLRSALKDACMSVQGSGWGVLYVEPTTGALRVGAIHDHQSDHVPGGQMVAVVDVWEHAYYLKYRNERAKWVAACIEHLDWTVAERRFGRAGQTSLAA